MLSTYDHLNDKNDENNAKIKRIKKKGVRKA